MAVFVSRQSVGPSYDAWHRAYMRSYLPRTEHCSFETRKFWKRVVERQDLSWAHKGKVTTKVFCEINMDCGQRIQTGVGSQGIEHQNHPNKIPLTRQNGRGKV